MCRVELVGGSTRVCLLFSLVGILSTVFILFMIFLHI